MGNSWLLGHPADWNAFLSASEENAFDEIAAQLRREVKEDLFTGPTSLALDLNDAFSPLQTKRMENMASVKWE